MKLFSTSLGFALAMTALAGAGAAAAAGRMSEAQVRYQHERAACINGRSNQDRATCLKEAGAAYQEARRGGLSDANERELERNRMVRCDALPAQDQQDCAMRMQGQGATSGSARQGGILRELDRPVAPRR